MRVLVRRINEWDAPTMLKVYRPYVENGNTTSDALLPTIAEYVQLIDKYTYGYGWIMSEIDGETTGFCYLRENRYDPEDLFSAEVNLFVREGYLRRGVGSSMYSLMFDIMEYGNKKKVFARIPLPNDEAVAFHEKWGFSQHDLEKNSMIKGDKTYDVLVMVKELKPVDPNASKPTKPYLIEAADYEKARLKAGSLIKEI